MTLITTLKEWWDALLSLFFPRCCVVCGHSLSKGEEILCLSCNIKLPRTNYHLKEGNTIEQLFWGKIPIERATSFFFYRKGSDFRQLLYQLKYHGEKEIGVVMGRYIATEILSSGFFDGIDVIVPIPLHPKKEKIRGYNQSNCLAQGISALTGIPINTTSVRRTKHTETQTHKSMIERWENVDGIFLLDNPERFENKHVLLIDDVLTTGATITACAAAFEKVKNITFSVLTLAIAD